MITLKGLTVHRGIHISGCENCGVIDANLSIMCGPFSLAKGFGPFLRGVWAGFREREGSIFSNHQHFAISTGTCGVACPLPTSLDKPLTPLSTYQNPTLVVCLPSNTTGVIQ